MGANHPTTIATLEKLATAQVAAGEILRALPLLEQSLTRHQERLGLEHPSTQEAMHRLATARGQAKQFEKSIPLFEQLLELRRATLGPNHPATLITMANLGVNYRVAGRLADAVRLLELAGDSSKRLPQLGWIENELITTYALAGNAIQGAALISRALTTARSELPPGSPALASALSRGGVQLLQLRMWSEADSILRECLKIREQISPDAAVNFNVKSLIGQALLGLGKSEIAHDPTAGRLKIDEAEKWLVDGYEGMIARLTQIPPDGRIRIKETLQYLVELYALTERPDKASSYRTKVEMFD